MSRNQSDQYGVIVIGGGSSGLMAAGRAASRGRTVLLLEKNPTVGKKLSLTGGGRCNITNAEFDTRKLLRHYGEAEKFLYSPFSQFGVEDTFTFFTERGLPLVTQDRNRVFPITEKATDVVRIMSDYVHREGVTVKCNTAVVNIGLESISEYTVLTDEGIYRAPRIIIATGGLSHATTGSTGEAFDWLRALGYVVQDPTPDIVPLVVHDAWVKSLSGKKLLDVGITCMGKDGKKLRRRGDILFTHFGMSGPLILNMAKYIKEMLAFGPVYTEFDLFPNVDLGSVRETLRASFDEHKNKTLRNGLREILPSIIVDTVLVQAGHVDGETKIHSVTREMREKIAHTTKAIVCTITDTMGFDKAVVSDGGIVLSQVDTRTMHSRIHPGISFTGDILHISRPSGGYSLQLCWTTGWVAGSHV